MSTYSHVKQTLHHNGICPFCAPLMQQIFQKFQWVICQILLAYH